MLFRAVSAEGRKTVMSVSTEARQGAQRTQGRTVEPHTQGQLHFLLGSVGKHYGAFFTLPSLYNSPTFPSKKTQHDSEMKLQLAKGRTLKKLYDE